jgi:hypothetical protein
MQYHGATAPDLHSEARIQPAKHAGKRNWRAPALSLPRTPGERKLRGSGLTRREARSVEMAVPTARLPD